MPSGGNSTGGNNSLLHLDSGSFIAVNLTASADSDTALAFDQINSLGMGLIANATLWFNGQTVPLWFNGQALPLAAVLPSTDLNNDGTANFTALLPAANLSVNTTAFLTNLAQNSTLVAGYAYDPDTGNIESFLLVPMTNPFIDPATKIPVVVPVNSAFNKQAVAENGYAIPDNADENLTCVSGPNEGELMVNYPGTFPKFIPGFFGIVPGTMPASFFDGANVTIVKLAVNDTETGQEEAGQVRFHVTYDLGLEDEAQYHIPISGNDVTGNSTVNNLVPALYAASPTIPNGPGVQYWVEGVTPGPITLQYTYTKGNITISSPPQKFLVCTQQSKADWQAEIRQQILLESGNVDMSDYTENEFGDILFSGNASPFMLEKQYVQRVYAYYAELYNNSNDTLLWAGLATTAGWPVYGAMNDLEYARSYTFPDTSNGNLSALANDLTGGYSTLLSNSGNYIQDKMVYANYLIYDDIAWQARAYQASGIWALRFDAESGEDMGSGNSTEINLNLWNDLYQGTYSSNSSLIKSANLYLMYREQLHSIQPAWDLLHDPPEFSYIDAAYIANFFQPPKNLGNLLSGFATAPFGSGPTFSKLLGPNGDISQFTDRWEWIYDSSNSIWGQWSSYDATGRKGIVNGNTFQYDAALFSLYCLYGGKSLIW